MPTSTGTLTLAQLKAERAVTGKAAPQEAVSLPSTGSQQVQRCLCVTASPVVLLIAFPLCSCSWRGLCLVQCRTAGTGGMSLSSFSHNSRLRGRLEKEKGRYLCDGEGEGCSASCMRWVKQCWREFAIVCFLRKPIRGIYLPQNQWLNS